MSEERLDRAAGVVGAITYALVGLFAFSPAVTVPSLWWWAVYAGGAVPFALTMLVPTPERLARWLLAAMVVVAALLHVVEPRYDFGAVPMVIVAACAGSVLGLRWALLLVLGQALVLVGVSVVLGEQAWGVPNAGFYAGFQLFAVFTVRIAAREERARARLASAHEQLSRTHADLEAAQLRLAESSRAEERVRISRDLHDLVGHQLSALAVNLEVASHLADGRVAEPVHRAQGIAKDLLADVRSTVTRLRDARVDLPAAVAEMARNVHVPRVHLQVDDGLEAVSAEPCEAVLRCVQEILTNAVRHSGAENVEVALTREGGELLVDSHDDGHGCAVVVPGNGLTGMRERLEAVGGSLHYDGSGAGFRVRARMPVGRDAGRYEASASPGTVRP